MVADIYPGGAESSSAPRRLVNVGGRVVFTATHPSYGEEPWRYAVPFASVAAPAAITEGGSLQLDASASFDPDGLSVSFAWDINGDGLFNDATGATPSLSWSQLQAL